VGEIPVSPAKLADKKNIYYVMNVFVAFVWLPFAGWSVCIVSYEVMHIFNGTQHNRKFCPA
jgi:hypothetical protein